MHKAKTAAILIAAELLFSPVAFPTDMLAI